MNLFSWFRSKSSPPRSNSNVAECGHHLSSLKIEVTVRGEKWGCELLPPPLFCPDCLIQSVVDCYVCGRPIFPDQTVAISTPRHPESFEWPAAPVFQDEKGQLYLVQCCRLGCAPAGLINGVMEYPGEIRRVILRGSLIEKELIAARPYLKQVVIA